MSFCNYSRDFSENNYTSIENKFITKYMPQADNAAVKVYLYGLYLCQNSTREFTVQNCAEILQLSVETIIEAFEFWEDCDLVQIVCREPFTLEYLPVTNADGRPRKVRYEKYADFNKELQRKMQSVGMFLDYSTLQKYMNFLQANEMEQQAFLLIAEYCIQKNGNSVSHAQIFNKAKNFIKRGYFTYSQVEKALSDFNVHTADLKRVLTALTITREPDESDYAFFEKWTASGFNTNSVIYAAKYMKRGSMPGLDVLLEELQKKGKTTYAEVESYLTERELLSNMTFRIGRSLGLKISSPIVYNEEYTGKWYNHGFEESALCALALFCVKTERNSFAQLDELVERLYAQGIVTEEGVQGYLNGVQSDLKLLVKIQKYCADIRRTEANLETVAMWRRWNFDDNMILEAAKKATNISHPVPYMNKILSDWKRENIFTIQAIPNESKPASVSAQRGGFVNPAITAADEKADRERYYSNLRRQAETIAERNEQRAKADPRYKEITSQLFDAEREAAKAEVFTPQSLPQVLQKIKLLQTQRSKILSDMGMTDRDLAPVYNCKKCSDSGFLPDGRACDCYVRK